MPLQRFALFAWQLSGPSPGVPAKHIIANDRKHKKLTGTNLFKSGLFRQQHYEWSSPRASKDVKNSVLRSPSILTVELPNTLIHHFFHSIHASGVRQMNMMLGAPQVESGPHIFECPGASILYRFDNGAQVSSITYDELTVRYYGKAPSEYSSKPLGRN